MTDGPLALHLVTLATSHRAPLWVAVVLYAMAHADQRGHAELRPGELLGAVAADSSGSVLSRAIGTAVRNGWLREGSNAWHLVLAGQVARHGS
jgi:hypothetical protein